MEPTEEDILEVRQKALEKIESSDQGFVTKPSEMKCHIIKFYFRYSSTS